MNKPTPVLRGKSAKRFYQEINQGEIIDTQKEFLENCRKSLVKLVK